MHKFVTECIGMFIFSILIGTSTNLLGIGLLLAAITYIASDISESHFNPAVSFAVWLHKRISLQELGTYISAQVTGTLIGGMVVWWLAGTTFAPSPGQNTGTFQFAAVEIIFSFVFVLLFLMMMYPKRRRRNPIFGFMIGLGFAGCYLITEPISGTGLNPSISFGFILLDVINSGISWYHLPIYLLSPGIGAILATWCYKRII
jgi:glycerol uptake facilitator-like aquaporin